jgi:hypothetical protein
MTIDLTGPVPHAHLVCDGCGSPGMLYRLIGTYTALCQHCFAKLHG